MNYRPPNSPSRNEADARLTGQLGNEALRSKCEGQSWVVGVDNIETSSYAVFQPKKGVRNVVRDECRSAVDLAHVLGKHPFSVNFRGFRPCGWEEAI